MMQSLTKAIVLGVSVVALLEVALQPKTPAQPFAAETGDATVAQPLPIEQQVEDVVSRLVGVMDTSAQAAMDEEAPDVRMTTCEVQLADATAQPDRSIFLYQEQAMSARLDQPYRQRFLQISPSADGGSVQSTAFRPLNAAKWIGLCNQPAADRIVQQSDLDVAHCSVFLRQIETGYIGETQLGGCPSNYRGAVRVTNRIVLHPNGMDTLDRGLDVNGNLMWGSTGTPYQFRRSATSLTN